MKLLKLPDTIQHAVLEYIGRKFHEMDTLKDLEVLMSMLSPSLKHMVTKQMFLSAINQISVFEGIPELDEFLVNSIEPQ